MNTFDLGPNWNGTRTRMHVGNDEIVLQDVLDAQHILDNNARLRGQSQRSKNAVHVADIPITIYHEWRKDWQAHFADKTTWHAYIAQKLNSRDWLKLRTDESHI